MKQQNQSIQWDSMLQEDLQDQMKEKVEKRLEEIKIKQLKDKKLQKDVKKSIQRKSQLMEGETIEGISEQIVSTQEDLHSFHLDHSE